MEHGLAVVAAGQLRRLRGVVEREALAGLGQRVDARVVGARRVERQGQRRELVVGEVEVAEDFAARVRRAADEPRVVEACAEIKQ